VLLLQYSKGDTWDQMLHQGVLLLERFCQDNRVRIRQPRRNLQMKVSRPMGTGNEFVAYIDAIGKLDGTGCLLEWKPRPAATRKSRMGCWLSTLSWFATRG